MKHYQSHISLSVSADDHRINASRCVKTFGVTLDDEWVSVSAWFFSFVFLICQ